MLQRTNRFLSNSITPILKYLPFLDWRFFARFLMLFVPLYYLNLLLWGLIDPRNHYSPFLDENLNYIALATSSILHTSQLMLTAFDLPTIVAGNMIYVAHGAALIMEEPCVGIGMMIFWFAFVFAGKNPLQFKIKWTVAGIAAIWMLNCLRICVLLFALQKNWLLTKYVDAHDMFNYSAYIVILLMILKVNSHGIHQQMKPERGLKMVG